jgi:hypothetical protein
MSQVFHLDVVNVDIGVTHIAVGSICNNHLLQLLSPPGCAWVWRGRHGVGAGHEAVWDTMQVRDTEWHGPSREAGEGDWTPVPYGCPGARRSKRRYVEGPTKNSGVTRLYLVLVGPA